MPQYTLPNVVLNADRQPVQSATGGLLFDIDSGAQIATKDPSTGVGRTVTTNEYGVTHPFASDTPELAALAEFGGVRTIVLSDGFYPALKAAQSYATRIATLETDLAAAKAQIATMATSMSGYTVTVRQGVDKTWPAKPAGSGQIILVPVAGQTSVTLPSWYDSTMLVWSTAGGGTTNPPPSGAAVTAAASATGTSATLTWATTLTPAGGWIAGRNGVDASGYGPWETPTPLSATERTFTFTQLVPSASYTLTVRAANDPAITASAQVVMPAATGGGGGGTPSGATGAQKLYGTTRNNKLWMLGVWTGNSTAAADNFVKTNTGSTIGADLAEGFGNWFNAASFQRGSSQVTDTAGGWAQGWPGRFIYRMPLRSQAGEWSWADLASGSRDDYFVYAAEQMVANGHGGGIMCLGWEINGEWFPWFIGNGNLANWLTFAKGVIPKIRAVAPNLKIFIDPVADRNIPGYNYTPAQALEAMWPGVNPATGKPYFDGIAMDGYGWGTVSSSRNSGFKPDNVLGWGHAAEFARAKGVVFGVPEWGLGKPGVQYGATGDDADFIQKVFDFFKANSDVLAFECFFNEDKSDTLLLSAAPNARARYQALWGALPAAPTTPPPGGGGGATSGIYAAALVPGQESMYASYHKIFGNSQFCAPIPTSPPLHNAADPYQAGRKIKTGLPPTANRMLPDITTTEYGITPWVVDTSKPAGPVSSGGGGYTIQSVYQLDGPFGPVDPATGQPYGANRWQLMRGKNGLPYESEMVNIPIPIGFHGTTGTDASAQVYDIGTDTIREFGVVTQQTQATYASATPLKSGMTGQVIPVGGYRVHWYAVTYNVAAGDGGHQYGNVVAAAVWACGGQIGIAEAMAATGLVQNPDGSYTTVAPDPDAIQHVIGITVPVDLAEGAWNNYSKPARYSDADRAVVAGMRHGQRLQLDPAYSYSETGMSNLAIAINRALRRYGAFVWDRSYVNVSFRGQPWENPGHGANPWAEMGRRSNASWTSTYWRPLFEQIQWNGVRALAKDWTGTPIGRP